MKTGYVWRITKEMCEKMFQDVTALDPELAEQIAVRAKNLVSKFDRIHLEVGSQANEVLKAAFEHHSQKS